MAMDAHGMCCYCFLQGDSANEERTVLVAKSPRHGTASAAHYGQLLRKRLELKSQKLWRHTRITRRALITELATRRHGLGLIEACKKLSQQNNPNSIFQAPALPKKGLWIECTRTHMASSMRYDTDTDELPIPIPIRYQ